VRRGAELVGTRGGTAPDFTFGTLYRLRRWTGRRMIDGPGHDPYPFLGANENLASRLRL
jgi:hypothetical protein